MRIVLPHLMLATAVAFCAPAEADDFRTKLRRTVRVGRAAEPMFELLDDLSAAQGIAIQIDPRVDRRAVVTAPSEEMPLAELLDQVARQADADARVMGRTILVTPRSDRDRVASLAAAREAELLDAGDKGRAMALMRRFDLSPVPVEATPAELLQLILDRFELRLEGRPAEEQLPYDLWRVDLRAVSAAEALAFVTVPCGSAFEIVGDAVRIGPLPERITVEESVLIPGNKRATPAMLDELRTEVPEVTLKPRGRKVLVSGTQADVDAVRDALRPDTRPTDGVKRYTLSVDRQPVLAVVAALVMRGLPIEAEGGLPAATVTLDLKEATLDEVGRSIAAQWPGVTITLSDERLRFVAEAATTP